MRITIQGSDRRVTLTKTERAKLSDSRNILRELANTDQDASAACDALCALLGRIDADGAYRATETEVAGE